MASIDQRVVSMVFENKQFEAAIKSTISTIDNLKKNLNMDKASSEFNKIEKASKEVTLNEMATSIDKIADRFSTMGIVGMTVLSNLTTSAMQAGKSILNNLTSSIVEGGKRRALNIAQAKFQLEGLGVAWETIEEDISYGVNDTAYGLDAAAKAASQLVASQVQLGDEMKTALRGISGVAAMTNSEYEDISNIFTTVAGNGRLMGDQLNQLAGRGLNVAAKLGEYLGKSETEIRDMVSKGQIDFKTFATAMDFYFGEHAKKANDTFTGALSNMKAALSRIGADFASPVYENMIGIINAMTGVFKKLKSTLQPLVDLATEGMQVANKFVVEFLNNLKVEKALTEPMKAAAEIIKRLAKAVINLGFAFVNVASFIKQLVTPIFGSFTEVFGYSLFDGIVKITEALKDFTSRMKILDSQRSILRNIRLTFDGIFTVVYEVLKVIYKVAGTVSGILADAFIKTFGFLGELFFTITGYFGKWIVDIKKIVDKISELDVVKNIIEKLTTIFGSLKSVNDSVYDSVTKFILAITNKAFSSANVVFQKMLSIIGFLAKQIDAAISKVKEFIKWLKQLPAVQKTIQNISDTVNYLKNNFGEVANVVKNSFISAFNKSKESIASFISTIKELIGQYVQLPTFQEVVENLQEVIVDVFEKSAEIFEKTKDLLTNIFERVKELNEISLKNAIQNFGKLKDKIVELIDVGGRLKSIQDFFKNLQNGILGFGDATGKTFSDAQNQISQFIEWLKSKFKDIQLGDLIAAGAGASLIGLMVTLSKFTSNLSKMTEALTKAVSSISKVPKALAGTLDSISGYFKSKGQAEKIAAISEIIKSLVLLAGALALLSTMDQERVRSAALTIGVLATAMVGLTIATNLILKEVSPETIAKTAATMIPAAASMLALCVALRLLVDVDMASIAKSLVALGVVMAEFAAFLIFINRTLKPTEAEQGTVSIVGFALSMTLLANAIKLIGGIEPRELISAVSVMTFLMGFLTILIAVAGKSKIGAKSALAVIGIVSSITLMMIAIKKLADIKSSTMTKGIGRMIELMGVIALLMLATNVAGKYAVRAGASLILISAALIVMTVAINKLADLNGGAIKEATSSVEAILVLFALLMGVTRFAGANAHKAALVMLSASVSMIVLSGAIMLLGKIREEEIKRATKAITQVMAMYSLIIAATGLIKTADKTLKMITISIGLLAAALAILSLLEPENLKNASICLSMVIGTFSLVVASTGLMQKANSTLAIMMGVIVVLAGVLAALSQLPMDSSLKAALALSTLLLAISASVFILQNVKAPLSGGALIAVAELSALIFALAGVFTAIGGLIALIPGATEFLQNGIPVLQALGEGLGTFVGSIIGGFMSGATSGLIDVADNLSQFMEHLQPFIEDVKNIDPKVQKGINTVIGMVLSLTATSFISSITMFGSMKDNLRSISESLPILGEGIVNYSKSISGIDYGAVETSSNAVSIITNMLNSLPNNTDSAWGFLAGRVDLNALAISLPMLGKAFKLYAKSISGMDVSAVETTKQACEIIIDLASALPNSYEGLLSVFTGGSFIPLFADQIPMLGRGFKLYAANIAGMDASVIENTEKACRIIIDLASALPNSYEGLLSVFTGGSFIPLFASQIPTLGRGFKLYAANIAGMDSSAVENTENAAKIIIALAQSLPKSYEGLLSIFTGGTFIPFFADQIPTLGGGFKLYAANIAGMDSSAVENTENAAKIIIELAKALPQTYGGLASIFTGQTFIPAFATQIPILASGFTEYSKRLAEMNPMAVMMSKKACDVILEIANSIPSNYGGIVGFFTGNGNFITNFANQMPILGGAFAKYALRISIMDPGAVLSSKPAIMSIIDIAKYITASEIEGIIGKVGELPQVADKFNAYYNGIKDIAYDVVQNSVYWLKQLGKVIKDFPKDPDISGVKILMETLQTAGRETVEKFVTALNEAGPRVSQTITQIMREAMNSGTKAIQEGGIVMNSTIKSVLNSIIASGVLILTVQGVVKFKAAGINLMRALANGISSSNAIVTNAVRSSLANAASVAYTSGQNIVNGLTRGINSKKWDPVHAVRWIAEKSIEVAQKKFDEASPSKVFKAIGVFVTEGLAIGIRKPISKVIDSTEAAGDAAIESMQNTIRSLSYALEDSSSFNPTITPVLDVSSINQGMKELDNVFNNSVPSLSTGAMASNFGYALGSMNKLKAAELEIQNGSLNTPTTTNYEFVQNNYSPKALNRAEIYRQTKNQFSRFKEASAV